MASIVSDSDTSWATCYTSIEVGISGVNLFIFASRRRAIQMASFQDFVEGKRRKHEKAVARHERLKSPITWRMRLRVQLLSHLSSDALEIKGHFKGRRIVIKSRDKGQALKDAEWLVFLASRFKTPEAAVSFGISLQSAISAIGTLRGIPVDVGFDNVATIMFGDELKDELEKKHDVWIVDDVHGVDVYPDTATMMVAGFSAKLSTAFNPEWLTATLKSDGKRLAGLNDIAQRASLLINAAYMAPHPVAMITLGVAAVEMMAKSEKWNVRQKDWIKSLPGQLEAIPDLSEGDRRELRHAINGLNHFGALSSTRRLFHELDLIDLLARWEALYKKRSRLFHGSHLIPLSELQHLGGEAREISQAVFKAYIDGHR